MRFHYSSARLVQLLFCWMVLVNLATPDLVTFGQESPNRQRGPNESKSGRIYRHSVVPHWFDNNRQFWYRNDLAQDAKEFIVVDAVKGTRQAAFDHQAMARALGGEFAATHLPISTLEFDAEGRLLAVMARGKRWTWDRLTSTLSVQHESESQSVRAQNENRAGSRTGADTSITFINQLPGPAEIFWLSDDGSKVSYGKIAAGSTRSQHTFGGHRWQVTNHQQESLGEVIANDAPTEIVIDGRKYVPPPTRRQRQPRPANTDQSWRPSPDGKWTAAIQNFNVVVRSVDSDQVTVLSSDGRDGLSYEWLEWSPDSQSLITFRVHAVDVQQVHRIRSSPENGGRAQLESNRYLLPGDPQPKYELNLLSVATGKQLKPEVDLFEHEWQRPRIRFNQDGSRFYYEQTDRGHGRFRLIEIATETGSVRNVIDEKSPTFIWTAHTENQSLPIINWLAGTNEIIHVTEKNGWRQLILIDVLTGQEQRELTPRGIVVRGIDLIDEDQRRIWFTASGRPNQDPYLVHFAHVDLDSGKLTWITEADGNHVVEFSPDRKYAIDTYSRVDTAPVTELRDGEDGRLIVQLEQADLVELSDDWVSPEVFVAKGRDAQTDIWGIICRPKDFDPAKKYPVIEDIYAGPHGSFVPKSFSASSRYQSLTSLGFIVVKIDGMGTAHRSKAFHDVCWKNLKDGGFQDRIAWLKSAAARHPELDLTRVGIYGTSAGGQNAAAAVLFHPEFYKVAVAACGCHDNRMDKASWNEQWMGYPVDQHYSASSNIDNAYRLQGQLLLIVGEMDKNVPPESTMRFADALIRADKDFDLLVVPNAGHGMGGAYGQRRMHNFFVEHLLGK